jgi:hypothetical protein
MDTTAGLPADIASVLASLHANARRAEDLVARHAPAVLERVPAAGEWSAAQCLAHLAAANRVYIGAMRAAIQPALHLRNHERSGPVRPGLLTRWFLAHLEPPVGVRVRTPAAISPPPATDARAALRALHGTQAAVIELLMECRQLDLNRVRFANPFLPLLRLSAGAGFLIIAAHERRHLWQAEQAIAAAGQPAVSRSGE